MIRSSLPAANGQADLGGALLDQRRDLDGGRADDATQTSSIPTVAVAPGNAATPRSPSGRVRCSAAEGVRAAVLAHLGLTVASDWMFAPELADGRVVRVLEDWALPDIDLWAVFPTGRLATAKARLFAAFVKEVMHGEGA